MMAALLVPYATRNVLARRETDLQHQEPEDPGDHEHHDERDALLSLRRGHCASCIRLSTVNERSGTT